MRIEIVILVLFIIDMVWSYSYINRFKERHPDKDWTLVEANIILRDNIRRFGLVNGMLIGSTILLGILGIIMMYCGNNFKYFLSGLYFMVNVQHLVNWNSLKMLEKIKK